MKGRYCEYSTRNSFINHWISKKKDTSVNKMLLELEVNKDLIRHMRDGKMPSADKLAKIANYLGVSTDYLLGILDSATPIGKEKTADDVLNEFASKEGFSNDTLNELKKFAELLKIKEMQKRNTELANELLIKD